MEEIVKINVQPLSAAALRPYGPLLERGALLYPETEEGRVAMALLRLKRRPQHNRLAQLALHCAYHQTCIPVHGSMVLLVAPPPQHRDAAPAPSELDYAHAAAFSVEPGQVACIAKGVWHSTVPIGSECPCINVTRKNAHEGATEEGNEVRMERLAAVRPYVGYVALQARENHVLELEL